MKTKSIISFVIVLTFFALAVGSGYAQGTSKGKSDQKEPQRITVTGKVDYQEKTGGYIVRAENPPAQLFIVNPDKKSLDPLSKSGKPAKIEGALTIGADHLKIEKINGKPYPGAGRP